MDDTAESCRRWRVARKRDINHRGVVVDRAILARYQGSGTAR